MFAKLSKATILLCSLGVASIAIAQTPDCLDESAALDYWRSIASVAESAEANVLAEPLLQCLKSPNPELRDDIGYGLFSAWLRNAQLSVDRKQFLLQQLSANLSPANRELSLQRSFSALIISELLRADAIDTFMTTTQREQLLQDSAQALRDEQDFRGFEDELGWVHPIAHLADVMWRFSLHPALSEEQAALILTAVSSKVSATESFYHFNEGDRLARPVVILLRREALTSTAWLNWFAGYATPKSVSTWSETFGSSLGLTELHNTKLFFRALSDQLQGVDLDNAVREKLDELVALFSELV
tara:strand:- start:1388 stop:2290 length:903 start_codon:yes stop_codon:yes gene_type:complete